MALFYSTWCPYCIRFLQIFENGIANLKVPKILYVILDDYDNSLWDEYNIAAVPTLILFKNCQVNKRLDGRLGSGLREERFLPWLDEVKRLCPSK